MYNGEGVTICYAPGKEGNMGENTDAKKRAHRKYMEKFVEVKVRMTPEKRTTIQAHAEKQGESTTAFINRAIDETMERDSGPTEGEK